MIIQAELDRYSPNKLASWPLHQLLKRSSVGSFLNAVTHVLQNSKEIGNYSDQNFRFDELVSEVIARSNRYYWKAKGFVLLIAKV